MSFPHRGGVYSEPPNGIVESWNIGGEIRKRYCFFVATSAPHIKKNLIPPDPVFQYPSGYSSRQSHLPLPCPEGPGFRACTKAVGYRLQGNETRRVGIFSACVPPEADCAQARTGRKANLTLGKVLSETSTAPQMTFYRRRATVSTGVKIPH